MLSSPLHMVWDTGLILYFSHSEPISSILSMKPNLCVRLDFCSQSFLCSWLYNYTPVPFGMKFCSTFHYWCSTWPYDCLANGMLVDMMRGEVLNVFEWFGLTSWAAGIARRRHVVKTWTWPASWSQVQLNSAEPNQVLRSPDEMSWISVHIQTHKGEK